MIAYYLKYGLVKVVDELLGRKIIIYTKGLTKAIINACRLIVSHHTSAAFLYIGRLYL
jgi:hypothetical protein